MKAVFFSVLWVFALLLVQCGKRNCDCVQPASAYRLTYGDSTFYLKKDDYTVSPLVGGKGTYTAFPDNLQIDRTTGAITITQKGKDGESQTGMRYKIKFRSNDGLLSDSTTVLLSGLTYADNFFKLAQGDSIIYPIYNGDVAKPLPSGDYDLTGDNKFAVNAANGQINVKECMRRGFFNSGTPQNTSWKIATVRYALNDNSQRTENRIDLVLYYYNSMADVPSNVSALMQAHRQMTVGLPSLPGIPSTTGAVDNNLPSELALSKPRPPCIVIISH